jgi:hypothetical protein
MSNPSLLRPFIETSPMPRNALEETLRSAIIPSAKGIAFLNSGCWRRLTSNDEGAPKCAPFDPIDPFGCACAGAPAKKGTSARTARLFPKDTHSPDFRSLTLTFRGRFHACHERPATAHRRVSGGVISSNRGPLLLRAAWRNRTPAPTHNRELQGLWQARRFRYLQRWSTCQGPQQG